MKNIFNFNDGIVYFYKNNEQTTSFKASKNIKTKDNLELISTYFFNEETQRHQDIVFAGAIDKKLSLKISIPFYRGVKINNLAVINNYLFSIFHIDPDKNKNKTYIYLEGMRKIER